MWPQRPRLGVDRKDLWLVLLLGMVLVWMIFQLRFQGRPWFCACGEWMIWSGDVWSRHNSQHLSDPYSITHLLHGFVFCAILVWLVPHWPPLRRFSAAMVVEALWEVLENTSFVVDRYRANTAAMGYEGDSIVNSVGDVLFCGLGFAVARRLGWLRAITLFVVTEIVLLFWIRDNLTLNVIMLFFPIDALKQWQLAPA